MGVSPIFFWSGRIDQEAIKKPISSGLETLRISSVG
jgi:hypothetical protein